jgi:hypothetical protein
MTIATNSQLRERRWQRGEETDVDVMHRLEGNTANSSNYRGMPTDDRVDAFFRDALMARNIYLRQNGEESDRTIEEIKADIAMRMGVENPDDLDHGQIYDAYARGYEAEATGTINRALWREYQDADEHRVRMQEFRDDENWDWDETTIDPSSAFGVNFVERTEEDDYDDYDYDSGSSSYYYGDEVKAALSEYEDYGDPGKGFYVVMKDDDGIRVAPEAEKRIRDTYEMELGDFRMVINRLEPNTSEAEITVAGIVQKRDADGRWNEVGTWTVTPKRDGTIEHDYLQLSSDAQGAGMAAQWRYTLIPAYVEQGITGVTVHANIDVGGYAWAKAGFTWNVEHGRPRSVIMRLERLIERWEDMPEADRPPSRLMAQAQSLVNGFNNYQVGDDRYPSPQDVAKLGSDSAAYTRKKKDNPVDVGYGGEGYAMRSGDDNEIPSWPGKDILLGSDWYAIAYVPKAG